MIADSPQTNVAFKGQTKCKIVRDPKSEERRPCAMCGTRHPSPDAAHIIDGAEWKDRLGRDRQSNGIPLCPNCHKVFDEFLRPRLYAALIEFGATGLPEGWKKSNKITVAK